MNLLSKRQQNQQGLTLISLIFVLGMIGAIVLLVLKIGPIYMDHGKVTSALNALKETPDVQSLSASEIRTSLLKRFQINYVDDVGLDEIKITKHGNYVKVEIEYDTIVPLVGNLSALAEFHDEFEAGQE